MHKRDLFTWELVSGTETDLNQAGAFPRYSPDGSQIALSAGGVLTVLTLADGATSAVTAISGAFQAHDWLPNGDLVIVSDVGIERVTMAGARTTITTVTGTVALDVDVSPDGAMVAYRKNGQRPTFIFGL